MMETMREITVNINGTGGMALFQAAHGPLAGHDIVVTSGEDGVVYLTDLTTERVASETVVCDGAVPACAVTPEQTHLLVVQDEENALYSYVMPSSSSSAPEIDKLLFRSTVAIRHVACSQKFVAVADEEATVKVLLRAASDQVIVASGHGQGVKSVAIDPSEQFLCSSSEDGTVRVFELQADERMAAVERAVFTVQYKDMRDDEVLCRCAWQRGERARLLAVPVNQGVVELFDRSAGWASAGQLLLPSSAGKSGVSDVNVLAFSPNGLYVAGATLAKQLVIWSVATKDVLRSFAVEYAVLGVEWAASQNALVAFHAGGKLAFVKDVVPLGRTPPQVLASASVSSDSAVGDKAASTSVTRQSATTTTTVTTAAKKRKKAGDASFVDDEAAVDGDASGTDARETDEEDETETRVEAIKASFGFGRAAAEADATLLDDDDNIGDTHDGRRSADNDRRAVASVFRPHLEPFQPGSVQGGGSAVCLLAWTPVGEIETVRGAASGSSTQENVVTVAFADKARRGFKFSDKYLFSMAALGDTGAFFGVPRRARDDAWDDDDVDSDQNDDAVRSSFVFYRPFEAWAPNSSWHAELPAGEDAECVAAGADFCAVATSLHCLRVYTAGGVAYAVARLPGRVVTMCARASRLAVVYQNDACGDSGALAFQLLKVRVGAAAQRVTLLATGRVPLSPPPVDVRATAAENAAIRADPRRWATLTWLGLDDRLVLYAVDSRGCVLTLSASVGWNWFPVGCVGGSYNSNAALPSMFPLGVVNDTLLYVPLEPGARVPRLRGKHRPVPLAFALRTASFPPSTALSSSKKQKRSAATDPATGAAVNVLWQNVRLCALEAAADEQDDSVGERERDAVQEQAEMDKALILMMKAACASDEPARVLDLAKCLHLAKSHQIAQKLAVHFGLRQLQSELFQLYVHMFEGPSSSSSSVPTQKTPTPIQNQNYASQTAHSHSQPSPLHHEPLRASLQSKALLSRRVAPQHEAADAEQDDDNEKGSRGDNSDAHETTTQETTQEPPPSSFFAKASRTGAAAAADATAKPVVVERSVAPANPFRKSAGEEKPGAAAAGLRRLAKFASPPPAKKRKPGK